MKKLLCIVLIVLCLFTGCAKKTESDKLEICATLFPQYDFCRNIVGDRANVFLLLPPGMESHNFEPSVSDILSVRESDLFLFTGSAMEPWAETVLNGAPNVTAVDLSQYIDTCTHLHTEEDNGIFHDHGETDPHIWTSPLNAVIMVQNILTALCNVDQKNAEYYRRNAKSYIEQLEQLDSDFKSLTPIAKNTVFVHGGKFSLTYLARDYSLNFVAAYDSCASSAEPSALKMGQLVKQVNNSKAKFVFYEEINTPRIAQTLANETDAQLLLLHSCHNLTLSEMENGETYISLMKKNLINLKKATGEQYA